MGLFLNVTPRLESPLWWAEERIFLIPPGGEMVFGNQEFKVIYFFRTSGSLSISGVPSMELKDGDLLVIPHPCKQVYINPDPNHSIQIHAFRVNMLAQEVLAKENTSRNAFLLKHFNEIKKTPAHQAPEIVDSIQRIRHELSTKTAGWEYMVHSAIWHYLIAAARIFQGTEQREPKPEDGSSIDWLPLEGKANDPDKKVPRGTVIVNKAREYIHKNYHRQITLGEIALYVDRGEEHLSREFKKIHGVTVFQYLRKTRIDASISLMADSSYTLTQIAEKTGFGSLAFFSHCFRKATGSSPSAYRAEMNVNLIVHPVNYLQKRATP